jgi:hypothetical protein
MRRDIQDTLKMFKINLTENKESVLVGDLDTFDLKEHQLYIAANQVEPMNFNEKEFQLPKLTLIRMTIELPIKVLEDSMAELMTYVNVLNTSALMGSYSVVSDDLIVVATHTFFLKSYDDELMRSHLISFVNEILVNTYYLKNIASGKVKLKDISLSLDK